MNQEKIQEIVEKFTENLNKKEKIKELAIIGREREIKEVVYILSRLFKNNPLLIGHPGVGKTAVVEGLVQKIEKGQVPDYLAGKNVYQLDMMALMAGTKFQGELESRLKVIFNYMAQPENNAILFIDEIHLVVGAGRSQGALDIANLLKPLLSRGEIQCIGATTQEEYRQYIEKDEALMRRFSNIQVSEPSAKEAIKILQGIRSYFEIYYELKIQESALTSAVILSQRYLTSTYLPDKAIDLLDETCGRVKSELWYEPEKIRKVGKNLQELETKKSLLKENDNELEKLTLEHEINQQEKKLQELIEQDNQEKEVIQELNKVKKDLVQAKKQLDYYQKEMDYERISQNEYEIIPSLKKKIYQLEEQANKNTLRKYFIDKKDIASTVARKYGLLEERILAEEQKKLLFLPAVLQQRIKGQDQALRVIAEAIFRARAGIQNPTRPLASFLFLGPTGVGKTEVASTIAEQLFDEKKNLIRLDMSEYNEQHSVSKLIGSPPGYIGHGDKPQLETVREKMYSVVLFDEIEKCHPEVTNLLLQILDNGFLTLANGREVNFRNTIIILTSNLGSELYFTGKNLDNQEELVRELNLEISQHFRPEFINRLDEIVFFNSLSKEVIREIIIKELKEFIERVEQEKNIKLKYEEKLIEKIFRESYSPEYGARPIRHYIEKKIGTLIARGIIFQIIQTGGNYRLDMEKETGEIKITMLSLLEQRKRLLKEKYE